MMSSVAKTYKKPKHVNDITEMSIVERSAYIYTIRFFINMYTYMQLH